MQLVWDAWSLPGLFAAAVAWALAVLVARSCPGRVANRRVAVLLAAEGVLVAALAVGRMLAEGPVAWWLLEAARLSALFAMPWLYLLVVATLPTPLARPLRSRAGTAALWAGLAVTEVAWWRLGPTRVWESFLPLVEAHVAAGAAVFGFVASVSSWRRAVTPLARRRSGWYAVAFAARDAFYFLQELLVAYVLVALVGLGALTMDDALAAAVGARGWLYALRSVVLVFAVTTLAYGILSAQLFEIDLTTKRWFRRGTVAMGFVLVFTFTTKFASKLVEDVLAARAGLVVAAIAAGVTALASAPLRSAAAWVVDRAMPGVNESPESRTYRKLEVYRAAAEVALSDGEISARERDMLVGVRESLGIEPRAARALEEDVRARLARQRRAPADAANAGEAGPGLGEKRGV